jgi:chitin disaccharide deacetylase
MENFLKVIINADDLGANIDVNSAIKKYAQQGLITSASVLSNGEDFEGAVSIAREQDRMSIGAHLNLSEYECLTKPEVFFEYGIMNLNGDFNGAARYVTKSEIIFNQRLQQSVYKEWESQITKIYDNNICVSHLDEHNYVHYRKGLFPVIKKLQKKFKINKIKA